MRKISGRSSKKLLVSAALDLSKDTEILLNCPTESVLVRTLPTHASPRYVTTLPHRREKPQPGRFPGLSPAINLTLNQYGMYKLCEALSTPPSPVSRDLKQGKHTAQQGRRPVVTLQPIGDAQTWTGRTFGILWECFLYEASRRKNWQAELTLFWQAIEESMHVTKFFTYPHDPAYPIGYREFLNSLGYAQDAEFPLWWSKVQQSGTHQVPQVRTR